MKNKKKAFEDHLEEIKEQKKRLQEICDELGFKLTGEECKAMKGLIEEADAFLKENAEKEVKGYRYYCRCPKD